MIIVKKFLFLIVTIAALAAADASAQTTGALLPDGTALSGVDGKLIVSGAACYFRTTAETADEKFTIKADTTFEMLPSACLEKMIANSKNDPNGGYRIWGTATAYKGKNYIYPTHFLPFSEQVKEKTLEPQSDSSAAAPTDNLQIPKAVLDKLKTTKVIQPIKIEPAFELKQDQMLVDRTGFILKHPDGTFSFVLDGLGRNTTGQSFRLLECQALEKTLIAQASETERLRLSVAGINTRFQGKDYLLLQRAARVYTYGNFPR